MTGMTLIRSRRGTSAKIAAKLGLTRGAVSQWDKVPAELVVKIEEITAIPRALLRPDLYLPAKEPANA